MSETAATLEIPGDFAGLRKLVESQGLMRRQPVYYVWKVIQVFVLSGIGMTVLFTVENFWIQMLNAAYLAFVLGQIGLIFHDAGHRQIFWSSRWNNLVGYCCSMAMGASLHAWMDVHNRHHAHPNREDSDPDIDLPFFAYSKEQVFEKKNPILRFITRYQAYLYFPLLMFTMFSMRATSWRFLYRNRARLGTLWTDVVTCIGSIALSLIIVFWALPFWTAIAFLAVHQLLWGLYMGSVFAPNHKGMEIIGKDQEIDFITEQVITSRNVRAHPLVDFWYGGLNYQVEHHLFPNMPRNKLRKANRLVQAYCKHHGIPYHETGVIRSYREIVGALYEISQFMRQHTAA